MIYLRNRTEFSFRFAIGKLEEVIRHQSPLGAGICDRNGTWGHVKWRGVCERNNVKPIYGVELAVVEDSEALTKQPVAWMNFLAKNSDGLKEIYELVAVATERFYYHPRIDYEILNSISSDVFILLGQTPRLEWVPDRAFFEINHLTNRGLFKQLTGLKTVWTCDNLYCNPVDSSLYETVVGEKNASMGTAKRFINDDFPRGFSEAKDGSISNQNFIADSCNAEIPSASMVAVKKEKTLEKLCRLGAKKLGVNLVNNVYKDRLKKEIGLIQEKDFEDYFFVVADMMRFARKNMLVGPARGSSCGSLVCYLLEITDIDPIEYDLLFERFIDVNRSDYPDIDVDLQDDKREMVFDYLRSKYGNENVSKLGTVNFFKPKSAVVDAARELKIPRWEIEEFKESIEFRPPGDERASLCVFAAMQKPDGEKLLRKFPGLAIAHRIEGRARHSGVHAAGILITSLTISHHCAIDERNGCAMVDKVDAEKLGMLKIDVLGLRTLSVIDDCLNSIGWTRQQLRFESKHPKDPEAFAVLNKRQFAGIFQFEGRALQELTKSVAVDCFEDLVSLTSLARPGPLQSGGAIEFVRRRTGKTKVEGIHPAILPFVSSTFGVIVYQEQVMKIAKEVGDLSWESVNKIRKGMGKSQGKEAMEGFFEEFREGAISHGMKDSEARSVWDSILTMGGYAFNRSHAVAYAMVSYWTMFLKAKFPLQFAASCLRHAKNDDQSIAILRELKKEGFDHVPFDRHLSQKNWTSDGHRLIGGLTAIKGVGEKLSETILRKRDQGLKFTPREERLLSEGVTPWDVVFEGQEKWGHVYENPWKYNIVSRVSNIEDFEETTAGVFVFLAKIVKIEMRDENDPSEVKKKGGEIIHDEKTSFLNLSLEDDTGQISAKINRFDFEKLSWIWNECKTGDWFVWKAKFRGVIKRAYVKRAIKMTGDPTFKP